MMGVNENRYSFIIGNRKSINEVSTTKPSIDNFELQVTSIAMY